MLRDERGDTRRYADAVLGEAVRYGVEVCSCTPGEPLPLVACRAAGRALQIANDMRDAEIDHDPRDAPRVRAALLYRSLPELPQVPRLLRWLPAGAGRGTRAAATLLAVTTCAFFLRQIGIEPRRPFRWPILAALTAALSPEAYEATVGDVEAVLRTCSAA